MLTVVWVGCGLVAYHAGNIIARKGEGHRDKLRTDGYKVSHRDQWKTCALDTALIASCCVMVCAMGSVSDYMALETHPRHQASKSHRVGDHKIQQMRIENGEVDE